MFQGPDPTKLRNSALLVGVVLLSISAAQVQIRPDTPISFLGIPLQVENNNFVSFSLIGVSAYFLFRYWFYCMRRSSTWSIRGMLKDNSSKTDSEWAITLPTREFANEQIEKVSYSGISYSDLRLQAKRDKNNTPTDWVVTLKNPKYSMTTFLRDVDFLLPVLCNLGAIAVAVYNVTSS